MLVWDRTTVNKGVLTIICRIGGNVVDNADTCKAAWWDGDDARFVEVEGRLSIFGEADDLNRHSMWLPKGHQSGACWDLGDVDLGDVGDGQRKGMMVEVGGVAGDPAGSEQAFTFRAHAECCVLCC